jgi:predicted DNA-binding protein|tara:strand:+ start:1592 stop:1774 length:183 start_codon:yes stop_codon:yes gene_type:complete
MGKIIKGKKGFQPIPKEQQRTKKLQIQLTPEEYNLLTDYCKNKGITKSDFIRDYIHKHIY